MGSLELRKQSAINSLKFLEGEIIDFTQMDRVGNEKIYQRTRNSVIHSFEFSLETAWKYLRIFLYDIRKINTEAIRSPRSVFKAAHVDNILSLEELKKLLNAVEDRNATSHAYLEEMAEKIAHKAIDHCKILRTLIDRLGEFS